MDFIHNNRDLTDLAKLVFNDLLQLCIINKGYCYISDDSLAQKFNKSKRDIRKSISSLIEKEFVICSIDHFKIRKLSIDYAKLKKDCFDFYQIEKNKRDGIISSDLENKSSIDLRSMHYYGQPIVSNKILQCVSTQFKLPTPLNTVVDILSKLFEKYSEFKITDLEDLLIKAIEIKNLKDLQGNLPSFLDDYFQKTVPTLTENGSSEISLEYLESLYFPSLAEYFVLHLFDISKLLRKDVDKLELHDERILSGKITDTYELVWHLRAEGKMITVKGKLVHSVQRTKLDTKLPSGTVTLLNSEGQELIVVIGPNVYQIYSQM